jgi:hypothetical protein
MKKLVSTTLLLPELKRLFFSALFGPSVDDEALEFPVTNLLRCCFVVVVVVVVTAVVYICFCQFRRHIIFRMVGVWSASKYGVLEVEILES